MADKNNGGLTVELNDFSAGDILQMLRELPDACCLFQVITDPFGTVQDMQFLFVNEKYSSLVGKPSAELIGATYYSTVSNRDEDWIRLTYQAAFMRQSVINRTFNTQFNKWFEFWAVPVYKKGFCAYIIHDVTAEKRKEETREIVSNSNNLIIECAKVLSTYDFKKGIRAVLKSLGAVLKADRVYMVESKRGEAGDFYEWMDASHQTPTTLKKHEKEKLILYVNFDPESRIVQTGIADENVTMKLGAPLMEINVDQLSRNEFKLKIYDMLLLADEIAVSMGNVDLRKMSNIQIVKTYLAEIYDKFHENV